MLRCVEFADLDEERIGPFLTSVTVRLCADQRRRAAALARAAAALHEPATVPGHDDLVCDRAEAAWAAGVLRDLPARQREVLQAKAEGMSCEAIARRYRMSYKAVESSLSRARAAARAALAATLAASWVFVRRSRPAVAVAAVPVVAAVFVLGVAPVFRAPAPAPSPGSGAARAPRELVSSNGRPDAASVPAAVSTPAPGDRPAGAAPGRRPVAQPAPERTILGVGKTDDDEPIVGVTTNDREFVDDPIGYLADCRENGVTISIEYTGCPGP